MAVNVETRNQGELNEIKYSIQIPNGNDFLKLPKEDLHQAMLQSWIVISANNGDQLIGTGRLISDGVFNGYICGLIVHPDYRRRNRDRNHAKVS